jgi:uncharacterized iron-regulated membrane protein
VTFRRILLTLHLWAALSASVFLLLLGATGSFMVYEKEVDHVLNRRLVAVRPTSPQLTLTELFMRLEDPYPGYRVTEIAFSQQPDVADGVYMDPGNGSEGMALAVNQYTGRALGDARTANTFVNSVHQFHTHLRMDKHREAAKLILGVVSLFLLFLSCSGIILWWRRKLFRINWRGSGKRINFDLHNVLGLWSSLFLFLFALTGVAMTWEGALNHLLNRVLPAGSMPERRRMSQPPPGAVALSPDAMVTAARAALPGAEVAALGMAPGEPVDVRMKFPEDRTPIGRSRVLLDPYTGKVLSTVSTRTAPLAFKISRMWIREIHTGDIWGWPTRLLACVMSLILPIMTITGSLIWWNRNRKLLPANTDEQG